MIAAARQFEAIDLEVRRGPARLVEGLSFSLQAGQRALIVGRNGTGKTSLLRILAGIAPVTGGQVLLDGRISTQWQPEDRAKLAFRGHLDGLKPDLTGRENVDFYASIRGQSRAVAEWPKVLGLGAAADRPVRQLSAGQKRRVGLAVLRASGAAVWFLDEPITNLDSEGRSLVAGWLDDHMAAGGMAVVATHDPDAISAPGTVLIQF